MGNNLGGAAATGADAATLTATVKGFGGDVTDGLWNFLGMALVGWGSVLLGGCPLRQLILSGEGNSDSAVTVFGMIVGGALAHNFALASSAKGPTANGQTAVIICFVFLAVLSVANSDLIRKNS